MHLYFQHGATASRVASPEMQAPAYTVKPLPQRPYQLLISKLLPSHAQQNLLDNSFAGSRSCCSRCAAKHQHMAAAARRTASTLQPAPPAARCAAGSQLNYIWQPPDRDRMLHSIYMAMCAQSSCAACILAPASSQRSPGKMLDSASGGSAGTHTMPLSEHKHNSTCPQPPHPPPVLQPSTHHPYSAVVISPTAPGLAVQMM